MNQSACHAKAIFRQDYKTFKIANYRPKVLSGEDYLYNYANKVTGQVLKRFSKLIYIPGSRGRIVQKETHIAGTIQKILRTSSSHR